MEKELLSMGVWGLYVQGGSQSEGGTGMGPKGFYRNPKVVSILILLPFPNGHPKQQTTFLGCYPTQPWLPSWLCAKIFPRPIITPNIVIIDWETAEKIGFDI